MTNQILIAKQPDFEHSEDYYFLRRKGIEFIEQMGSLNWTDYNSHDPGITILEALCYAITDLGFRTGWDIKDLLASPPTEQLNNDLQAFFTARNILTTNPLTVNDFRRLLADLEPIHNAWLVCRSCACEVGLYGNCKESKLGYHQPIGQEQVIKVTPRGTYDVLLEFENDPKLGDLNDRKLRHQFTVKPAGDQRRYPLVAEIRFPELDTDFWSKVFNENTSEKPIEVLPRKINSIWMKRLSLNTEGDDATNDDLKNWQNLFYTTLRVKLDSGEFVLIENATVRLFGKSEVREKFEKAWIVDELENASATGIVPLFFEKMAKVQAAILLVKDSLHSHRNLAEDFCCVSRVCVQDVAVCADIEVKPDADIDRVQSEVLFEIEKYFNPGLRFYSLQEMLEGNTPVEEIFEGPQLSHGFLKNDELEAAQLKHQLRTSDIINQLVEIDGVVAVKDLMLTRYDALGRPEYGIADIGRGNPKQLSARWTLEISDRCQPRLYIENSKFLFIKNGLPFLPRAEEVHHTLQQLRGESERLKITKNPPEDLPVPVGKFRNPEEYFPVQYSFPLTYGIGYEGLGRGASAERQAQAKQLKTFLLFFEQLLANQMAQLANFRQLFSLDPAMGRTYFTKNLRSNELIRGVEELFVLRPDGPSLLELEAAKQKVDDKIKGYAESEPEYLQRRNRFLDHQLSRFAEDFTEYALTQYSLADNRLQAQRDLIETKSRFLKNYPNDSRNRAQALDYRAAISPENHSVLRRRIARLLGLNQVLLKVEPMVGNQFFTSLEIRDTHSKLLFVSVPNSIFGDTQKASNEKAWEMAGNIRENASLEARYQVVLENGLQYVQLLDAAATVIARCKEGFKTVELAQKFIRSAKEVSIIIETDIFIIEHLLLRPRFPGDAIMPVCLDAACQTCHDVGPYSFQITVVMPGWLRLTDDDLNWRNFADRTIQMETPSHILVKICWLGNEELVFDPCSPGLRPVVEVICHKGKSAAGVQPTRLEIEQALEVVWTAFKLKFEVWMVGKEHEFFTKESAFNFLNPFFEANDPISEITDPVLSNWPDLKAEILDNMSAYFTAVVVDGLQYTRLKTAWEDWLATASRTDWCADMPLRESLVRLLTNFEINKIFPKENRAVLKTEETTAVLNAACALIEKFGDKYHKTVTANLGLPDDLVEWDLGPIVEGILMEIFTEQNSKFSGLHKFSNDLEKSIISLFKKMYPNELVEASRKLKRLIGILTNVKSIYPPATLHDCDDGNDENPVRLGSTALGGGL